jgi:type IV pilus assembly protein PilB
MQLNKRLAKFYVEQGVIDLKTANDVLERTILNKTRFDVELVKVGGIDPLVSQRFLAMFFNIQFLDFNVLSLDPEVSKEVPMAYMKDNRVIPIYKSDKITVAIDNPRSFQEALSIKHYYEQPIEIGLITTDQMDKSLVNLETKRKQSEVLRGLQNDKNNTLEEEEELRIVNAPAVQLTDSILREAVSSQASDIHIEPFEDLVKIRFRIDGALIENNTISKSVYQSVLARFKIISNLNIAERRIPQDGKIRQAINGNDYDFRVSTIPTIYGEKLVVRIYDIFTQTLGLKYLGARPHQEAQLREIITKPHGILLVTGPTGSGKSTTLYTFLKELNRGGVNVTTVEDPVENVIQGINQVQVNPKASLTFSSALRSILRQDPNIIMIGEIRDEETAQIAIRAAITGHLVLATLHTNDAIGSFDRLVDMGVPHYLVGDALIGAIAQRLVRKLCPRCKKEHETNESEMHLLNLTEKKTIMHPVGCESCNFTGYQGRTAVFEILEVDDKIRTMLSKERRSPEELKKILKKAGMYFLEDSCKALVLEGITSFEEYASTIA